MAIKLPATLNIPFRACAIIDRKKQHLLLQPGFAAKVRGIVLQYRFGAQIMPLNFKKLF
jgi:hypothetical protein